MNVILLSTLQSFSSPRERQRNSGTMMQKSSQTNPIKKHTQNLSFDKFDRIRKNFVHMKSISVEASREKKNDTGHKLEVEWLLLSFFYWKSEEILKASHSNDKKMHRNRIWAVIRRLQNEYMDTWLCPLFELEEFMRNREKKTADERTEYFKTFENILQFYFILFMFWLHLNPSSGFDAYSTQSQCVLYIMFAFVGFIVCAHEECIWQRFMICLIICMCPSFRIFACEQYFCDFTINSMVLKVWDGKSLWSGYA